MRIAAIPRQRRYFGPVHWGHRVALHLRESQIDELRDRLCEMIGRDNFRMTRPTVYTYVKFADKKHLATFKLICPDEIEENRFRLLISSPTWKTHWSVPSPYVQNMMTGGCFALRVKYADDTDHTKQRLHHRQEYDTSYKTIRKHGKRRILC